LTTPELEGYNVLPVLLWSQQVDRYILLLLPNMMSQAAVFDLFENDVSSERLFYGLVTACLYGGNDGVLVSIARHHEYFGLSTIKLALSIRLQSFFLFRQQQTSPSKTSRTHKHSTKYGQLSHQSLLHHQPAPAGEQDYRQGGYQQQHLNAIP
jgi:hypothetical protein